MKITTVQPEPVKPNVLLELTPEEFEALKVLCGRVSGDPDSMVRKVASEMYQLGESIGYNRTFSEVFHDMDVKDMFIKKKPTPN